MTDPTDELRGLLAEAERMLKVHEDFTPVPASWLAAATALVNAAPLLLSQHEADKQEIGRKDKALKAILFLRPGGPVRNKLVEQIENIARDALEPQALTPKESGREMNDPVDTANLWAVLYVMTEIRDGQIHVFPDCHGVYPTDFEARAAVKSIGGDGRYWVCRARIMRCITKDPQP